jgi:hypothetical protein
VDEALYATSAQNGQSEVVVPLFQGWSKAPERTEASEGCAPGYASVDVDTVLEGVLPRLDYELSSTDVPNREEEWRAAAKTRAKNLGAIVALEIEEDVLAQGVSQQALVPVEGDLEAGFQAPASWGPRRKRGCSIWPVYPDIIDHTKALTRPDQPLSTGHVVEYCTKLDDSTYVYSESAINKILRDEQVRAKSVQATVVVFFGAFFAFLAYVCTLNVAAIPLAMVAGIMFLVSPTVVGQRVLSSMRCKSRPVYYHWRYEMLGGVASKKGEMRALTSRHIDIALEAELMKVHASLTTFDANGIHGVTRPRVMTVSRNLVMQLALPAWGVPLRMSLTRIADAAKRSVAGVNTPADPRFVSKNSTELACALVREEWSYAAEVNKLDDLSRWSEVSPGGGH